MKQQSMAVFTEMGDVTHPPMKKILATPVTGCEQRKTTDTTPKTDTDTLQNSVSSE